MYLLISVSGDITVEPVAGPRDVAIARSLQAASLRAQRLSPNLTLITDASKRWGINRVASELLAAAGADGMVATGPAVLLSCDGDRVLDEVTSEALDALATVGALDLA